MKEISFKDFYDVQKDFIDFYKCHKKMCIQKNRQSGFTTVLKSIMDSEVAHGEEVLYISGCKGSKEFESWLKKRGIYYFFESDTNVGQFIGKRFDIIILDECAFLEDFKNIIGLFLKNNYGYKKLVIATTPIPEGMKNYKYLRGLFRQSGIEGNLFHFKRIIYDAIEQRLCNLYRGTIQLMKNLIKIEDK